VRRQEELVNKLENTPPMYSTKYFSVSSLIDCACAAEYMKARGASDEAFAGSVQRMVMVQQYEGRDRPSSKCKNMRYDARPLLRVSLKDEEIILNTIL